MTLFFFGNWTPLKYKLQFVSMGSTWMQQIIVIKCSSLITTQFYFIAWDFVPLFTFCDYVLWYFVLWYYIRVDFVLWDVVPNSFLNSHRLCVKVENDIYIYIYIYILTENIVCVCIMMVMNVCMRACVSFLIS